MTTFAVTDQNSLITAVNYAISNLGATTANITGNILTLNTSTNAITVGVGGTVYSYNVPWVNIRYANNATGSSGFTTDPNNASYYGIQATANATPSTINNPASYSWNQVAGGFGTTKYLFYQAPGGRQITFDVATTKPNSNFVQTTDNVAINLDTVTTAPPTPVVIGIVYQRNNSVPTTPTGGTYDFGNLILTAPTGWANSIPTGNAPVYTSQNSFQGTTANAIVGPTTTWTAPVISTQNGANGAAGANGTNGTSTYTVTAYSAANATPATPTGGTWNFTTSTGTPPSGNTTWTLYPANTTANTSLFISTAVASIQGNTGTANLGSTWSYPVNVGSSSGLQGQRGIIPLGYVLTPTDPTVANTATLSSWFSANRTNASPPIGLSNSGEIYLPIPGDTVQFQDYYNGNLVLYGTYTGTGWANVTGQVINGNIIFPGTITANAMNVNNVYALTLEGGGVTPGNATGTGYWLQANTGNAYFGGNITIGNSATIGSNVIIGNNASLGGNLTVAGLISTGNLVSNTVGTTNIVTSAVSQTAGRLASDFQVTSLSPNTEYILTTMAPTLTPALSGQAVSVYGQATATLLPVTGTSTYTIQVNWNLKQNIAGAGWTTVATLSSTLSPFPVNGDNNLIVPAVVSGYYIANPGYTVGQTVSYTLSFTYFYVNGSPGSNIVSAVNFSGLSATIQSLKR